MRILVDRGIVIEDGVKIGLDSPGDYTFISHAHCDHVVGERVICTPETAELIRERYGKEGRVREEDLSNMELLDAGHILGSSALFYKGEKTLLYTGDFCDRDRLFMRRFVPRKADILVIESTFGRPDYIFPDPMDVLKEARDWVEDELRKGNNVMLLGYSLGKAQILEYFFERMSYPIYIHGSLLKVNKVYSKFGIELDGFMTYGEARREGFLRPPFILIAPPKNNLKVEAKRAFFSGWAKDVLGYDASFPLSDHADFEGLVRTVRKVDPEVVYVTHGFKRELALELRKEGFNAIPL